MHLAINKLQIVISNILLLLLGALKRLVTYCGNLSPRSYSSRCLWLLLGNRDIIQCKSGYTFWMRTVSFWCRRTVNDRFNLLPLVSTCLLRLIRTKYVMEKFNSYLIKGTIFKAHLRYIFNSNIHLCVFKIFSKIYPEFIVLRCISCDMAICQYWKSN